MNEKEKPWFQTAMEIHIFDYGEYHLSSYRPACLLCGAKMKILKNIGYIKDIVFTCPKDGNDKIGPTIWIRNGKQE